MPGETCLGCLALKDQLVAVNAKLEKERNAWFRFALDLYDQFAGTKRLRRQQERDRTIYRLREKDPKAWTWPRLGSQFDHMGAEAARKAYKRQAQRIQKAVNLQVKFLSHLAPPHLLPFLEHGSSHTRWLSGSDDLDT